MDKLRMKFSALNVDFNGLKVSIFYVQENLRTMTLKSGTPVKVATKWLDID